MKKILFTLTLLLLASCGMDKEDCMIIHSMKMKYRDPALVGVWIQDTTEEEEEEERPVSPYYLTFKANGNFGFKPHDPKAWEDHAYYTNQDTVFTYVAKSFKVNSAFRGKFRYKVVADTLFIYSGEGYSKGETAPNGRYYKVKE